MDLRNSTTQFSERERTKQITAPPIKMTHPNILRQAALCMSITYAYCALGFSGSMPSFLIAAASLAAGS
jgi:hypothetical protein